MKCWLTAAGQKKLSNQNDPTSMHGIFQYTCTGYVNFDPEINITSHGHCQGVARAWEMCTHVFQGCSVWLVSFGI